MIKTSLYIFRFEGNICMNYQLRGIGDPLVASERVSGIQYSWCQSMELSQSWWRQWVGQLLMMLWLHGEIIKKCASSPEKINWVLCVNDLSVRFKLAQSKENTFFRCTSTVRYLYSIDTWKWNLYIFLDDEWNVLGDRALEFLISSGFFESVAIVSMNVKQYIARDEEKAKQIFSTGRYVSRF